jgi:hypothetical protein
VRDSHGISVVLARSGAWGDHKDGARPTLPYPERDHCGDIFDPTLTEELECGESVRRGSTESRPIDTNARRSLYDSTRDRNGCRAVGAGR